jgi:dihydroorotase-like cyclic amidohydrolase
LLIKNTTVWTNETDGILKNTDVLLKDGKIAQIGKDLDAKGIPAFVDTSIYCEHRNHSTIRI